MNATSLLMIVIGIFIIINASNFVDVIKGGSKIGTVKPSKPDTNLTPKVDKTPKAS